MTPQIAIIVVNASPFCFLLSTLTFRMTGHTLLQTSKTCHTFVTLWVHTCFTLVSHFGVSGRTAPQRTGAQGNLYILHVVHVLVHARYAQTGIFKMRVCARAYSRPLFRKEFCDSTVRSSTRMARRGILLLAGCLIAWPPCPPAAAGGHGGQAIRQRHVPVPKVQP